MRSAAKLLMAPTRDAIMSGPALREALYNVGWYLATELLSNLLRVQETKIHHVQGGVTSDYRLFNEDNTIIIAVMRGGEHIAFAVSDVFPIAVFLHARKPEDVALTYFIRQSTVILVDSDVNNGRIVPNFVQHPRSSRPPIRVVVVAGDLQAGALRKEALLVSWLASYGGIDLFALRISKNKCTGRGGRCWGTVIQYDLFGDINV